MGLNSKYVYKGLTLLSLLAMAAASAALWRGVVTYVFHRAGGSQSTALSEEVVLNLIIQRKAASRR
jgi:hypothetical protein